MSKRVTLIVTMLVVAALAIAACAPGNTTNETPGAQEPMVDTPVVETPVVEPPAIDTPVETPVVDTPVVETPVVETPVTETPDAAETPDADPVTGVPIQADAPFRLQNAFDHHVVTQDDENLGALQEILVSRDDGQILYAVLQTDDVGGIGGEKRLVPWSAFTPIQVVENVGVNSLVISMNADTVRSAPAVDLTDDILTGDAWDDETFAYWEGQGESIPVTGPEGQEINMTNPVLINNSFFDKNVVNTQDEDLGEVDDFIVSADASQIHYMVIEAGGVMDIGSERFPIAWQAATFDEDDNVVLNLDQETLNNVPGFDDWDDLDLTIPNYDQEWETFWAPHRVPQS